MEKKQTITADLSWMQDQKRFYNLSLVGRYNLSIIANTVRHFVNNDVQSHILNLLSKKLLSHSDDATGNVQTLRDKTNTSGKQLASHSFNADDDVDGLLSTVWIIYFRFRKSNFFIGNLPIWKTISVFSNDTVKV